MFTYRNITGNATTVVKDSPGILASIIINNNATEGSVAILDSADGQGTRIFTLRLGSPAGGLISSTGIPGPQIIGPLMLEFNTGLTVITSGSASNNITVLYR